MTSTRIAYTVHVVQRRFWHLITQYRTGICIGLGASAMLLVILMYRDAQ